MTLRLAGPLLLVGAGKMGGALLEGWLRQGLDPSAVFIQDPAPPPEIQALALRYGIAAGDAPDLPAPPSVIVVAVKPQIMDATFPPVAKLAGPRTLVLSIAAGRSIARNAASIARIRLTASPRRAAVATARCWQRPGATPVAGTRGPA